MSTQLNVPSTDQAISSAADAEKSSFPGEWRERIAMSSSEWAKVPDNPIQRNTALHARRAKHLRMPSPMHRFVTMAELPDGRRFKVDGHTRSFLWENGELERPHALGVDVIACRDIKAVELLYRHFDNPLQAETAPEQLTGALRLFELDFETPMLRDGCFSTSVKRAYIAATGDKGGSASWRELPFVYSAVEMFIDELVLLDSISPTPKRFPVGVMIASLVTLRRAGKAGLPFWQAYAADQGCKADNKMDAVQALSEEVLGSKQPLGRVQRSQWHNQLFIRGVTAFEGWRVNRQYSMGLKSMARDIVYAYARGPKQKLLVNIYRDQKL